MEQEQAKLIRLLDRIPLYEFVRILFTKTNAQAKEFSRVMLQQVYFTFNQALFLLTVLSILIAVIVSAQAGFGLSVIGASGRIGELWTWMVFRVFGPLLSALLIIARSCTAVATETAVMKFNREIEALELMGIPAVDFVFAPRILAGAISGFCMAAAFVVIAFFGTWVSNNWFASMSLRHLYAEVSSAITPQDVVYFILKTTIVGGGIFWIACRRGLSLDKGSFEVPVVAMQAVVDGFIWAIVTNIFFTALYVMWHGFYLL